MKCLRKLQRIRAICRSHQIDLTLYFRHMRPAVARHSNIKHVTETFSKTSGQLKKVQVIALDANCLFLAAMPRG